MGIATCSVWLVLSSLTWAQTSNARIEGLIADETGAILPGVQVAIHNAETGATRNVMSNDRGRYVVTDLPPGAYEITATMTGFDTLIRRGITLTVGQDVSIPLTMRIGSVNTQVTVTAEAPLVNTTSSGVSGVVEERRITELPLNGRDFGQLALVQPGALNVATAAGGDASKGFGTRLSLSGSRPMDTGYSLDGTNVNSVGNFATPGSAAGVVLGVDAIREFRVVTGGGYSAEYGAYSGGVVQMVTKAGTNQYHGTAFGLHRNDNLDANTWENNRAGKEKAEFRRNQFGGSVGGPIRRDKTFFFGAYEGLRQARVGEVSESLVPDLETRQGRAFVRATQASAASICAGAGGTFSSLSDTTGRCAVAISPSVKPYLDLWPRPNGEVLGDGTARLNYSQNPVTDENYIVARGDYRINDNQSMFGRFMFDNGDQVNPDGQGVYDLVVASRQRFATIQYENVLAPTLLASSSLAFNRTALNEVVDLLIDYPSSLFFMNHQRPASFSYDGVGGFGSTNPATRIQNKWELSQSFSYSMGVHTLKFGGSYSHVIFNNSGPAASAEGSFSWTGTNAALAFLTDAPLSTLTVEVPNADTSRTVLQDIYGFYFQDDWRVRPNLTLNLGLRYEPWTSPGEKHGRVSTFRDWVTATEFSHPSTDGTDIYFNSPGESTFSPRVGLAWDVNGDGRTAVRAGAGIFHVMILSPYLNTVTRKNPPDAGTLIQNNPGVNFAGAPAYVLQRTPTILSTTLTPDTFSEAIQFDLDPMYETKFNLTIEREILPDLSASIGYVGSRGTHLTMKSDCNAVPATLVDGRPFIAPRAASAPVPRVNPNNGVITCTTSDANSFYNAMSIEVKKRLGQGFQFQAVYTWSKNVDDSTTGLGNSDFSENLVTQPYNHKADRGLAATHVGQNLVFNGLWSLPSPTGNRLASGILGGWQLSGILRTSTGVPRGPKLRGAGGRANAQDGRRGANEQAPELRPGRTVESMTTGVTQGCAGLAAGQKLGTPDLYFDPCAFTIPAPGFYGNAGRNIIIGPGFLNADVSLTKSTAVGALGENGRVNFHADLFNLMNRPNFGRPSNSILTATGSVFTDAGRISSTVGSERQLQFGLKIIF
jgi:hypothetical protein